MSATYDLFLRWKAHKAFPSDRKAMLALKLDPSAITPWKEGRNGSLAVIERMAKDLGEDPVPTIMRAWEETLPLEPDKRVARRVAKRLGGAAVLAFSLLASAPAPSHAAQCGNRTAYTLCAVRRRRVRRSADRQIHSRQLNRREFARLGCPPPFRASHDETTAVHRAWLRTQPVRACAV